MHSERMNPPTQWNSAVLICPFAYFVTIVPASCSLVMLCSFQITPVCCRDVLLVDSLDSYTAVWVVKSFHSFSTDLYTALFLGVFFWMGCSSGDVLFLDALQLPCFYRSEKNFCSSGAVIPKRIFCRCSNTPLRCCCSLVVLCSRSLHLRLNGVLCSLQWLFVEVPVLHFASQPA